MVGNCTKWQLYHALAWPGLAKTICTKVTQHYIISFVQTDNILGSPTFWVVQYAQN